jgi:hypothetical protein
MDMGADKKEGKTGIYFHKNLDLWGGDWKEKETFQLLKLVLNVALSVYQ